MTNEERERIYQEVRHEINVRVAKEQVERLLPQWRRHLPSLTDSDYDQLASRFEEYYEDETSENDQWAKHILWYLNNRAPNLPTQMIEITCYPNMLQDGTLYIPASLTAQDDIAQYVKDHWDEISWGDMDEIDGDIEFRVATPDGDFIYDSYS